MSDRVQVIKNELDVAKKNDIPLIVDICRALSVPERLQIINILMQRSRTITEIAKMIDRPLTSATFHVKALEKAKIIYSEKFSTLKGTSRICYINCFSININFLQPLASVSQHFSFDMPVGHFTSVNPGELCGIACAGHIIQPTNDPTVFYRNDRIDAQIVWMNSGNISYKFPNILKNISHEISDIKFSLEICSEAPNYRIEFPSDITIWVNDTEVLTFTSPGDFGERRGKLTPEWWPGAATQYGILKNISIRKHGSFLDEKLHSSDINLEKLNLNKYDFIKLTVGIKENARFIGGFNLFGEKFGDFPQNILMEIFTDNNSEV